MGPRPAGAPEAEAAGTEDTEGASMAEPPASGPRLTAPPRRASPHGPAGPHRGPWRPADRSHPPASRGDPAPQGRELRGGRARRWGLRGLPPASPPACP